MNRERTARASTGRGAAALRALARRVPVLKGPYLTPGNGDGCTVRRVSDQEPPSPTGTDVERRQDDDAPEGAFAFFSLEGMRFDGRGMPADAAREVAAFRAAVLHAARSLYKERHGGDVPSVFDRAFDLRLVSIGRGSARPEMVLDRGAQVTPEQWADFEELYELGRDLVTRELDAVTTADEVPLSFDRATRRSLARLGGSLKPAERLRVGPPAAAQGRAVLTPRTRELLRKSAQEPESPEERDISLVGVVTEYDSVMRSFDLVRDDTGKKVKCVVDHYDAGLAERVRSHMSVDGVTAPDVRVEGQTWEPEDRLIRQVHNVHQLEVVWTIAEKVVVQRIRELAKLKPGWLGPGTDAPTPELAALVEPLAGDITSLGIPVSIVPNAAGSFVLEWRAGDVEYTAELGTDRRLFMCADNVVTDNLDEREVDFDSDLLRRFLTDGVME